MRGRLWFALTLLLCAHKEAHAAAATTCAFEGDRVAKLASKKGYTSVFKASDSATCQVLGDILVVSAGTAAAATCSFSIFIPPAGRQLAVEQVEIKPATGIDEPIYVRKVDDGRTGLAVTLTAPKGQTVQFRISQVEISVSEGPCDNKKLEELL